MSSGNLFASMLMACVLAVGFVGVAPAANATPLPLLHAGEGPPNSAIEIKHRRRGKRGKPLYVPIVPYSAYDYPYYYRRGFYPTHIGRGYVYYGYPYSYYRRSYTSRVGSRCSAWNRRCVGNGWRFHKGACRCR